MNLNKLATTMNPTIRYESIMPSYTNHTSFLLGNGMKNKAEIYFLPVEFNAFFDSEFGCLKYEYMASGGWQSNKKAMSEISQLTRLGLKIGVVYITANYPAMRCTNCRNRFARYAKAGKIVKSGNIQTFA